MTSATDFVVTRDTETREGRAKTGSKGKKRKQDKKRNRKAERGLKKFLGKSENYYCPD